MIKQGSKVKVHYTGRLTSDEVFDTSLQEGRDPIEFTMGEGQLIPGFENGVMGLNVGDFTTIEIKPEDGYGEYRQELVATVPKSNAPAGVEVGHTLQAHVNGEVVPFMVRQVNEDNIVVDGNHPLAGQVLIFEVQILDVAE